MTLNPSEIQAIIFDLDGLLIDTEPIWARVETLFLERRGLRYDPELARQTLGRRVVDVIRLYQQHYNLPGNPREMLGEWVRDYLTLTAEGIPLRPGADEAVRELSRRYATAIASSSPRPLIERVVAMFDWTACIRVIQSGDDVVHGKPAPDIFLAAALALDVEPARCLVLEDSLTGVQAAKSAGMYCFAVPNLAFYPPEAYGQADAVYPTLHEVRQALLPSA